MEKINNRRKNYLETREKQIKQALDWNRKNRDRKNENERKWRREKMKNDPEYREKIRKHSQAMYRKHKAKRLLYSSLQENTERQKARHELRYALRKRKIVRPVKCDSCNNVGKVEGHHSDYSKPLSVIWLCRSCHELIHHKN